MLFYSCWYLDLTQSIYQNPSVVIPASHCSDQDQQWEDVEIYWNYATSRHLSAIWWHYPGLPDCYQGRSTPTSVLRLQSGLHSWQYRLADCSPGLPAIIVILVAAKVIWWLHQDLLLSVNYQSFHCSYHHCQYNKRSHTRGPGLQSPHFKWLQSAILGLDCTTPISYYRSLSHSLSLSLSDIQIILANICYWE